MLLGKIISLGNQFVVIFFYCTINNLFSYFVVNMDHIGSSRLYFGSPKGSPKYGTRLANMISYLQRSNQIILLLPA